MAPTASSRGNPSEWLLPVFIPLQLNNSSLKRATCFTNVLESWKVFEYLSTMYSPLQIPQIVLASQQPWTNDGAAVQRPELETTTPRRHGRRGAGDAAVRRWAAGRLRVEAMRVPLLVLLDYLLFRWLRQLLSARWATHEHGVLLDLIWWISV